MRSAEVHPDREAVVAEAALAGRRAEVEDVLARGQDAPADDLGEELAQPGAAGEHEQVRGEGAPVRQPHALHAAARGGPGARLRGDDLAPLGGDRAGDGLAGPAGGEVAGLRLVVDAAHAREVDAGEAAPRVVEVEALDLEPAASRIGSDARA